MRRLLAADAAGAEAHHGLALELGAVRLQRGREFGELGDAPVDRAVEGAVVDLEGVARVQQSRLAALVVVALVEPALEGGASTPGARPAAGWMAGWSMRMISRLTFTSMRRNGCAADQLSLASRSAKRASARRSARKAWTASASVPARNRLMPSGPAGWCP
jgi:hypothetical protein